MHNKTHTSAFFILFAILLFFLGGMYSWFLPRSISDTQLHKSDYVSVAVKRVQHQDQYTTSYPYTGMLVASRESNLGFERSGKVIHVEYDEGDRVQTGEILAQLDTDLLKVKQKELGAFQAEAQARLDELQTGPRLENISEAKSDVERWQAQLEIAELSYQRMETLVKQKSVSVQKRDEALYAKDSAKAQLDAAKQRLLLLQNGTRAEQLEAQTALLNRIQAQIETVETESKKSSLIAPYHGIVTQRYIDEGTVLPAGSPVLHLIESGTMTARIGIPYIHAGLLQTSASHSISIHEKPYQATLRSILPVRDPQIRTVTALFDVDTADDSVRVGDLVKIHIEQTVNKKGVWLPISSLTESVRGLWACYIVEPVSDASANTVYQVTRREIDIQHTENGRVYVQGMIQDGELVITKGVHNVVPDQQVTVQLLDD